MDIELYVDTKPFDSARPFSHMFQAPSNDSSEEDFTETC